MNRKNALPTKVAAWICCVDLLRGLDGEEEELLFPRKKSWIGPKTTPSTHMSRDLSCIQNMVSLDDRQIGDWTNPGTGPAYTKENRNPIGVVAIDH